MDPAAASARYRGNVVLSVKAMARELRAAALRGEAPEPPPDVPRPLVRGDCVDSERPCPWVSCKYHLFLDVKRIGSLILNHPDLEPDELPETCALDIADRGGATLEVVGALVGLTRERIRQVEERALESAHLRLGVAEDLFEPSAPEHVRRPPRPLAAEPTPPPDDPPPKEMSTRLWSGEVPNTPIAPPRVERIGLSREQVAATVRRVREALRHPGVRAAPSFVVEKEEHPPAAPVALAQPAAVPALPAEEETVSEKTCSRCGKPLRSDNARGRCGDGVACTKRAGGATPPPDDKPDRSSIALAPKTKDARPRPVPRPHTREDVAAITARHLSERDRDELLRLRAAIDVELEQRLERAEADAVALRAALGKAA